MKTQNIAVIGGSIAGTAISYFLTKLGHRVTIYEREQVNIYDNVDDAWKNWSRKGAPHAIHSHILLPRLVSVLTKEAPELFEQLLRAGSHLAHFSDYARKRFSEYVPMPEDAEMTVLKCRRIVLENESRKLVISKGVIIADNSSVEGLITSRDNVDDVTKIIGLIVSTDGIRKSVYADIVIDASGRRSQHKKWLSDVGVSLQSRMHESCGVYYTTQWFKLKDKPKDSGLIDVFQKQITGVPYYESSFLNAALVFADNGYYSITLTAQKDDVKLRKITKQAVWRKIVNNLPGFSAWIDVDNADPVTDIITFGNMNNTYVPFLDRTAPLVVGFINLGDSLCTLNPAAGRGCSVAWFSAHELARLITEENSLRDICVKYYEFFEKELMATITTSANKDRTDINHASVIRTGVNPYDYIYGKLDQKNEGYIAALMTFGLKQALANDINLYRKYMRVWFLLSGPEVLMEAEVIKQCKVGLDEYIANGGTLAASPGWEDIISLIDSETTNNQECVAE